MRLLVEPPVSVEWPSFTQTLSIRGNDHQPFGMIDITRQATWGISMHFNSTGHAYHALKNGLHIRGVWRLWPFFNRLVRDGRAEYIWGPHSLLFWLPDPPKLQRIPDAFYGYRPRNPDPIHDKPPHWE